MSLRASLERCLPWINRVSRSLGLYEGPGLLRGHSAEQWTGENDLTVENRGLPAHPPFLDSQSSHVPLSHRSRVREQVGLAAVRCHRSREICAKGKSESDWIERRSTPETPRGATKRTAFEQRVSESKKDDHGGVRGKDVNSPDHWLHPDSRLPLTRYLPP